MIKAKYLLGLMTLLACGQASANAVYKYVGGAYFDVENSIPAPLEVYTTSMRITGTIELADFLPANRNVNEIFNIDNVLNFSFFDGLTLFTKDLVNPAQTDIKFGTDATGNISNWLVGFTLGNRDIEEEKNMTSGTSSDVSQVISCNCTPGGAMNLGHGATNQPGTWSLQSPSPVPLPGTLGLLSMGIAGLAKLRRTSSR